MGNTTTQDAAKSIIDINNAPRPPNAKLFGAIVNELRSRPVAAPLNVRQRINHNTAQCYKNPINRNLDDTLEEILVADQC